MSSATTDSVMCPAGTMTQTARGAGNACTSAARSDTPVAPSATSDSTAAGCGS